VGVAWGAQALASNRNTTPKSNVVRLIILFHFHWTGGNCDGLIDDNPIPE
jgi:hypothetical protein